MWRVISVALLLLLACDYAIGQTVDRTACHSFKILSFDKEAPPKELESAIRSVPLLNRAGLRFIPFTSSIDSGDVRVTVLSSTAPSGKVDFNLPSSGVRAHNSYTLIAERYSDFASRQSVSNAVAGNWQTVAHDIVTLVWALCPSAAPASVVPVFHPDEPLTAQQRETFSSARTIRVESLFTGLELDSLLRLLAAGSKAGGLAVSFVPGSFEASNPDATVQIKTSDELRWNIVLSRGDQTATRQAFALNWNTAIPRIAETILRLLSEADGKSFPAQTVIGHSAPAIHAKATLFAGPFGSQGDKVSLYLDAKAFEVRSGKGVVLLTVPAGNVLDIDTHTNSGFHYSPDVDPFPCEGSGEACGFAVIMFGPFFWGPSLLAGFHKGNHFLDVAWFDGEVIKRASFELTSVKQIDAAVKSGQPQKP